MAGDTKVVQSGDVVPRRTVPPDILDELRAIRALLRGDGRERSAIALAVDLQDSRAFARQAWQRFHTRALVFRSNGAGNVGVQIGMIRYIWRTPRSGAYTIPFYVTIERGEDVFEPPTGVPRAVAPTLIIGTPE